jgi:esterase/lipase superfamily enzyme
MLRVFPLLALGLAACRAPSTLVPAPSRSQAIDTIAVVSARGGDDSTRISLVAVEQRASPWHRVQQQRTLSAAEFAQWVEQRGGRPLVFVHGAGTSEGRAVRQGATLARRGGHHGPVVVFAWPTHSIGVAWPRTRPLLAQAYVDDSVAAVRAASMFAHTMRTIAAGASPDSVVIVAHSLGARLVSRALAAQPIGAPIGTVALLAGDVGASTFAREYAPALTDRAHRRIVYVSARDRLLWLSRRLHGESRIGEPQAAATVAAAGIEVVDISAVPLRGSIFRAIGTRHAVTRLDGAIADLFGSVIQGGTRDATTDSTGVVRLARQRASF